MQIEQLSLPLLSTEEIIHTLLSTDILVGVYGSELITALFMAPGSAVVEIFPPSWDDTQYQNYVQSLQLLHFTLKTMGELGKVCTRRPDSHECYTKGTRDRNVVVSLRDAKIIIWKARGEVLKTKYGMTIGKGNA